VELQIENVKNEGEENEEERKSEKQCLQVDSG
jgi:hypothetical protein